jgi:hypothetical protein
MNGYRITQRGYRVLGVAATIALLFLMGIAGWIEGLS